MPNSTIANFNVLQDVGVNTLQPLPPSFGLAMHFGIDPRLNIASLVSWANIISNP